MFVPCRVPDDNSQAVSPINSDEEATEQVRVSSNGTRDSENQRIKTKIKIQDGDTPCKNSVAFEACHHNANSAVPFMNAKTVKQFADEPVPRLKTRARVVTP